MSILFRHQLRARRCSLVPLITTNRRTPCLDGRHSESSQLLSLPSLPSQCHPTCRTGIAASPQRASPEVYPIPDLAWDDMCKRRLEIPQTPHPFIERPSITVDFGHSQA